MVPWPVRRPGRPTTSPHWRFGAAEAAHLGGGWGTVVVVAASLTIDGEADSGAATLRGELDTHTSPALATWFDDVGAGADVVLDLAETTFISSAGLSVLLNAQRRLSDEGGSLTVGAVSPNVGRLIELSGLAETLGID